MTDVGGSRDVESTEQVPSPPRRRRIPWARLLRRLLHIDALACPRCSTAKRSVPMVVLAFLTDPDVVGKILDHLGLPTCAPGLGPANSESWQQFLVQDMAPLSSPALGCTWPEGGAVSDCGENEEARSAAASPPVIRPPP